MIHTIENLESFKSLLEKGKPLLAIDYGTKYLGIAKTDNNWILSIPLDVIKNDGTSQIKKTIETLNICGIIMGLPLQMDGFEGENCEKVRKFAEKLVQDFNLPIYLQDERLTTKAAQYFLNQSNLSREQKNFLDNKLAASLILESFLQVAKFV